MRRYVMVAMGLVTVALALASVTHPASSAPIPTWQSIPAAPGDPGAMFLLTNGQVLVSDQGLSNAGSPGWWLLTPSQSGSYVDGTWSAAASLPASYGPLYFASGILPDGKLLIEGGEFNGTATWSGTNQGALYDPVANTWTPVAPPQGGQGCWAHIADAPSAVLDNGTFLLGDSGSATTCQALFSESTGTWTTTGAGKADPNTEEGFTLLPSGKVLDVNTGSTPTGPGTNTEVYDPTTGTWSSAGNTPTALDDASGEVGPATMMPNGDVFAEGATGATAIYDTASATWSAGPMMPTVGGAQMTATDSCSAVLPDGNVLFNASPGMNPPTAWYTFDGTRISPVANDVGMDPSKELSNYCNALVLPTGQVLVDDRNGPQSMEVYNDGGVAQSSWRPTIRAIRTSLVAGTTYALRGSQLSGLDQGSYFGDDLTNATNYPLVQVTNTRTHRVTYARTFGFSSTSIAPGASATTRFVIPASADDGPSTLRVIANGIASAPRNVAIAGGVAEPTAARRTSILCVRARVTRRITAVNPRCPVGFRKKS